MSKADPKEADNSSNKTPEYGYKDNYQSSHNKYRNDNYRHFQGGQSNGGNMNRNRMKYDNYYNQRDLDNDGYNDNNRYLEPRYYDRRLNHYEQHNNQKIFPNNNNGPLPPMKDPMNAMMNMFNPMMAAFLQQISNG